MGDERNHFSLKTCKENILYRIKEGNSPFLIYAPVLSPLRGGGLEASTSALYQASAVQ